MRGKSWQFLICGLLFMNSVLSAQIARQYEPVIIVGEHIPEVFYQEIDHLYLFAYDAATDNWEPVPFQIDEADTSFEEERKFFEPEVDVSLRGLFDFDDELVFMADDLGDRADSTKWITDADTFRCEIEVADPLGGEKGYVYLYYFQEKTIEIPTPYQLEYDSVLDQINTINYKIGFDRSAPDTTGQLCDVWIKSGTGEEIFDRMKLRLYGIVKILIPLPISAPESGITADSAYAKVGPVRIIRNLEAHFSFQYGDLRLSSKDFIQPCFFYPWHGSFNLPFEVEDFSDYGDILYARMSWDMNSNATGMKFFSENNTGGILVDGNGNHEAINTSCSANELNWTMISGTQGTMLDMFYVQELGSTQGIFYFDNTDGDKMTTGDDFSNFDKYIYDTGDEVAYGESGFYLYDPDNIDVEEFKLNYHNFFLPPPPDFTPEMANQLTEQFRHPLTFTTDAQFYTQPETFVDEAGAIPDAEFVLHQNYPNPFNAATIISFSLPDVKEVTLTIYDLMGKQVYEIVNGRMVKGTHRFTWSGMNDLGEPVSTGLYFYKLKIADKVSTKKLLYVK